MKKVKYILTSITVTLLMVLITSCGGGGDDSSSSVTYTPGAPFVKSDLAGTWYIFATNGANTADKLAQGNIRGQLTLDASGNITQASYTRSSGGQYTITNTGSSTGFMTIDGNGVLGGSATTSNGLNIYIDSGKMDPAKTTISFVSHTNYGEQDLFIGFRSGGSFASSNLTDSWYLLSSTVDYAGMALTDQAAGNGVSNITSGGGGFIKIDGSGLLSGTGYVDTNTGKDLYLTPSLGMNASSGKISSSHDMMVLAASLPSDEIFPLVIAMQAGGTFATSDLTGTWYTFGTSSSGTSESTISGTLVVDSEGSVTGGSYTRSDGSAASFSGGKIAINNAGALSGNATTNEGDNITLTFGKMHVSKNILSFVATMSTGENVFLFCINKP